MKTHQHQLLMQRPGCTVQVMIRGPICFWVSLTVLLSLIMWLICWTKIHSWMINKRSLNLFNATEKCLCMLGEQHVMLWLAPKGPMKNSKRFRGLSGLVHDNFDGENDQPWYTKPINLLWLCLMPMSCRCRAPSSQRAPSNPPAVIEQLVVDMEETGGFKHAMVLGNGCHNL